MSIFHSIESVLSVYIIIAFGFFLTKYGVLDSGVGRKFAWLVVNLTFPCYIIAALPEQFSSSAIIESVWGILIAVGATAILYPIGYFIARVLKISNERKDVFVAMIVFSNVIFIGLPVNYALFGDEAVPYVLQYYLANTIIFWTLGVYFLQRSSNKGSKGRFNLKLIINPPLVATFIAVLLALLEIKVPFIIKNPFQMIGDMTSPLATLFIGIVFYETNFSDFKVSLDMVFVTLGRFVLAPVMIYLPLAFTSFPLLMKEVFFIQAAMPVMNQVTITACYYGSDYKYSTVITIWSFIISMVMIPIYVFVFGSGIL